VIRGDVYLAQVAQKRRPVAVLTRTGVLDVRSKVTVAEITTSIRGLAAEVPIDHDALGLREPCVVNCDGLHTIALSTLTTRIGRLDDDELDAVCAALHYALGC
jgi:mRNA interferase MazF